MLVHAQGKNHSTTSEALGVGKAMNAEYTVLTHFSQRLKLEMPDYEMQQCVHCTPCMHCTLRSLHPLHALYLMFVAPLACIVPYVRLTFIAPLACVAVYVPRFLFTVTLYRSHYNRVAGRVLARSSCGPHMVFAWSFTAQVDKLRVGLQNVM
jgi:hypothetical protein